MRFKYGLDKKEHYEGIVVKKYRDKRHRYTPIIVLNSGKEAVLGFHEYIYDETEIGDSLSKLENSLKITKYRSNEPSKDYYPNCGGNTYKE